VRDVVTVTLVLVEAARFVTIMRPVLEIERFPFAASVALHVYAESKLAIWIVYPSVVAAAVPKVGTRAG